MTSRFAVVAAVGAVLFSSQASAQIYVVQSQAQAYTPLSGTGVVTATLVARSTFTADDEGYVDIPLGFNFPLYGTNFSNVHVDSNGFLMFHNGAPTVCRSGFSCYSGGGIPSTTRTPHAIIAPWWSDMSGSRTTSAIKYKVGAGEVDIEWVDWHDYASSGSTPDFIFNVKVKITASGMFQIHYGTLTGTSTFNNMTAGWENDTGSQGSSLLGAAGCYNNTPINCCSATTANCTITNWPNNTLFTVGQPVQPDIAVPSVNISNLTQGGGNLSLTVNPTFRNFGQNATGAFQWRAYLSTDRNLDGADILLLTGQSQATIAGGATASPSASGSVPTPPPGQYYVLVQADYGNAVTEALETNNVGSTANYFVQGLDLVTTSVSGPVSSGPSNAIVVNAKWFNQGTDPAGTVNYRVLLSTDTSASANDFVLYTTSRTVSGGQTIDENLNITVPGNVPGGDFHYILQLDHTNSVTEASETNNAIASVAKVTMSNADLVNQATDWVDPITGAQVRLGDFGSNGRVRVTVNNAGGANANNFKVGVVISADANLSLISDSLVAEHDVALVAAGATQQVDFTFPIPLLDAVGQPFTTGNYFIFVILDSRSAVTELNEANNNLGVTGTVRLRAPAPDLSVLKVDAPASAGAGELIPVYRVIKNVGNVNSAAVKYRYVASVNTIITPDDIALPIQGAGGTMNDTGTVTLAIGATDAATELVRLPGSMTAGTWYVGVIADSDEQIVELDEVNNATASTAVQVAGSSLKVTTSQLPDAIVDRPYSFRLVAQGEQGVASTWAIDPAQGALPAGLTLGTDGLLSGTPTAAGVFAFTAVVTNGTRQTAGRVVLRVLPTTVQVEITSVNLPPVVNSPTIKYETVIGAAGGVKPYRWRLVAGAFPQGVALAADGTVSGNPRSGQVEGNFPVTVEVRDSLGSAARKDFVVKLVAPGAIVFNNLNLPDGLVGVDYVTDVSVKNADGSALAKPLQFSLIGGFLPEGLEVSTQGDLAFIQGKPLNAGTFPITLQVEDGKGRSSSSDFVLRIFPARFRISAVDMPAEVHQGDAVNFRFSATGSNLIFTVFAGALPKGLTLAPDGTVSGTVDAEAPLGMSNFVVEGKDLSGATGLGAFGLDVARPRRVGCSTTGTGSALWLLAALLPLAFRRKGALALRLRSARAAGVLLAVLTAGAAQAQVTYLVQGPNTVTYEPLAGATRVNVSSFAGISVNLPFAFNFYGNNTTSVGVAQHGYLYFAGDDGDSSNTGIPQTTTGFYDPTSFIAGWWDSTYFPSNNATRQVRWNVTGIAPFRVANFEWANAATTSTATQFSFTISLYESTNQIRLAYGSVAPGGTVSASVGIQKDINDGLAALACTTSSSGACSATNFPTNQVIDLVRPPDLVLLNLAADQTGYAGVPYRVAVTMQNNGGSTANNALVRFFVSADAALDAGDTAIGDATPVTSAPFQDRLVNANLTLPGALTPGTYFLIAQVDPDAAVVEGNETNNVATPLQFTIGPPTADLIVSAVSSATTGSPGGSVSVNRTLTNAGNAAAAAFKFTYFLSDNAVVSISDTVLGTRTVGGGLAAGAQDTGSENLTLPNPLPAGRYWVGICVNYDPAAAPPFGITEISQVNDCATAPTGLLVSSGQLAIVTTSVPPATQYAPYGVHLEATGGDGQYLWSLAGGALPVGVTLRPNGDLVGTPSSAGAFSFDARVQSAGSELTQSYSLTVGNGSIPLAVVDQDPPAAEFGRAYNAVLVAVGGKPPYQWTLRPDTRLPIGLALAPDGSLEGRATETGEFMFAVECQDSASTKSARELTMRVVNPSSLQVATTRLPQGVLTKQFSATLQAVGGAAPYDWSLVRFQQLPENATEKPGEALTAFPENFGVRLDTGSMGERYFRGVPAMAGLFSITLKVTDGSGAEDQTTILWRVTYNDPLSIVTTMLPDAYAGHEYKVRLSTNLPPGTPGVVFSRPCVQVAASLGTFDCVATDAAQNLPAGLELAPDGTLGGTAVVPASGKTTVYSFLVKVSDAQGRQDVRGLSIRVNPDYETAGSSCSGTGLGPALLPLLAALSALRRRRKSAN